VKLRKFIVGCAMLFVFSSVSAGRAQVPEKLLITHSSESIRNAALICGIEKGFCRREGIELEFRNLRGELAVGSFLGGNDVDFMYGAGTAITATVRDVARKDLLKQTKMETGVNTDINVKEIVDYSLLRQVQREIT
jgi:hypothetical protein